MPSSSDVAANLDSVRRRIAAAAHRVNRPPSDITLVVVTKTFGPEQIQAAIDAGHRTFGENRVQEALGKQAALPDPSIDWHLIGHLQTNKVKKVIGAFRMIQAVDRLELLDRLDAAAAAAGVRPTILLQVDLAGETTKSGAPEAELPALARAAAEASHVELAGLMLIPPMPDTPESSRPWFRRLRDVRDRLIAQGVPASMLGDLSMGMSGDFEIAVEEGATIVRVGSAIFGTRL